MLVRELLFRQRELCGERNEIKVSKKKRVVCEKKSSVCREGEMAAQANSITTLPPPPKNEVFHVIKNAPFHTRNTLNLERRKHGIPR
jgi:hypothetical protein